MPLLGDDRRPVPDEIRDLLDAAAAVRIPAFRSRY
jgi:hypothetical protein